MALDRLVRSALAVTAVLAWMAAKPTQAHAQTVMYACYVPSSGTVYRIRTADTRDGCASSQHVEFSWTDGAGADHGAFTGLGDDDHPIYLLTDGVRSATNGFAVTGSIGAGSIPASGAGVRLVWFPGKAAFRAGRVSGSQWDDANVGLSSVAMGEGTTASGAFDTALGFGAVASGGRSLAVGDQAAASSFRSIALGHRAMASHTSAVAIGADAKAEGLHAVAIGQGVVASNISAVALGSATTASGTSSTAMGRATVASGANSTAMGIGTIASGERSTAMGAGATTNGHRGSFVYGDASTFGTGVFAANTADNQFMVRAAGGTIIYSNATQDAGVSLPPGGGAWASLSDAGSKIGFQAVDGEEVLAKIAAMRIEEWSYRSQVPSIRHVGPTAQDFHAAFGLGESDRTITTVDIDGINLLASQTLERRTTSLAADARLLEERVSRLQTEKARLRAVLTEQSALLDALEARVARLEEVLAGRTGRREDRP